eukprot:7154716-Prymnesium_polylepis.1
MRTRNCSAWIVAWSWSDWSIVHLRARAGPLFTQGVADTRTAHEVQASDTSLPKYVCVER